ncbi:MAG TPA: methyltransferase domain-containing protein, partial [Urbifossiella sp.]|nr:methyltransferase domain-containing protein [Urbifossiella sp.]
MGISMPRLIEIERAGVIAPGRAAVLDIGVSNLHNATAEQVLYFFEKYPKRPVDDALRARARDLADRTRRGHPGGHTFLAEVFAETRIEYLALDVFPGPSTRIFDLNFDPAPPDLAGRFDLVLNFGTTEHVFSQYNAFKAIHDFLKVGGHVYHQIPTTGFFNHGYFKYHPRMFEELAVANCYHVVELGLDTMGFWGFEEYYGRLEHLKPPPRFR